MPGVSGFFAGLQRLGLSISRRLLAFWTKVTVLPEEIAALKLDSEKPICFVLESTSFSNLLILEQVCAKFASLPKPSAVLSVGSAEFRRSHCALLKFEGWFPRRLSRRYPAMLTDLVEIIRHADQTDLQIVPVSVFWGRQPEKEQSLVKLLFTDSWARAGRIRKLSIILLHGRNTWLQFSSPISLKAFISACPSAWQDPRIAHKLGRVLRVHFRQRRRAAIGPELSHLHRLVDALLQSRAVQEEIGREARDKGISRQKATARARRYAYEIAAAMSYPFLLIMRRLLRRLWDKLYDGVELGAMDELCDVVTGHTVVYLPCHRSHIDYLLLSYVLFAQGLAVPHVAAGINLNIPLVGPLLRRGGAFFLRRSFKGNRLYRAVFHHYLSMTLAKGAPVEYFIEGGRSRSGFSLAPKAGMLDMTVRSFLAHPDRPLVFLPVYIGYEKLVEGRSYIAELSGRPKTKETLGGFFRALRGLRSQFGKVYLNFSNPLYLDAFLDSCQHDWRSRSYQESERPAWLPGVIVKLADEVMTRINAAAAVNPINLLALSLLATPDKALSEKALQRHLAFLLALGNGAPYSNYMTLTGLSPQRIVRHGLELGIVRHENQAPGAIVLIAEKNAALLEYFRNNVLHIYALPAAIACCFRSRRTATLKQLVSLVVQVYPYIRAELYLHWRAQELERVVRRIMGVMVGEGVLGCNGDTFWRKASDESSADSLFLLGQIIVDFSEYVTQLLVEVRGREGSDSIPPGPAC